jgi:cation diffusion facilitator family transporter
VLAITLVLNLAVAVAKIVYGVHAGALAIRADGFHSLTDAINNVVGLGAVLLASRPADEDHPYGHRKFEVVAAGFVGVALLAMAYDVAQSAALRLLGHDTQLPQIGPGAFAVLLVTLAVNLGVARYESAKGRELTSPMLLSDAQHTRADALVTTVVLVSTAGVHLGYALLDIVAAFGVAAFIAYAGVGVLRKNLGYLADVALLDPTTVEALAVDVPGVASAHKIRTRGSPGCVFVDLHIQIAPHLDVVAAHRVTHAVIDAIKGGIDGVQDVLVHTEPAAPGQPYKPLDST